MRYRKLLHVSWLALAFPVVLSAAGGLDRGHAAISREAVLHAIALPGFRVSASQVEFLSPAIAVQSNPDLQVVGITKTKFASVALKMRCQQARECVPFYVLVHDLDIADLSNVHLTVQAARAMSISLSKRMVRGGDHATLILEDDNARVSMPVVVLENGAQGQRIRVASIDRKKTFQAEVIAPGMLKGTL